MPDSDLAWICFTVDIVATPNNRSILLDIAQPPFNLLHRGALPLSSVSRHADMAKLCLASAT